MARTRSEAEIKVFYWPDTGPVEVIVQNQKITEARLVEQATDDDAESRAWFWRSRK